MSASVQIVVDLERGLVLAQLHLRDCIRKRYAGRLDPGQRPRLDRFVFQVPFRKLATRLGEGVEIGHERDARQFSLEVVGESRAVLRLVQDAVDIVEDGIKIQGLCWSTK